MKPRLISPHFAANCWDCSWNFRPDDPAIPTPAPLPPPPRPFRPGAWTANYFTEKTDPLQIQAFARAAHQGLPLSVGLPENVRRYLDYYNRTDEFKNGVLPKDTLIMIDSEGSEETKLPELLAVNTQKITRHYVQYPPAWWYGNTDLNVPTVARQDAAAMQYQTLMWTRNARMVNLAGDYLLHELYLPKPRPGIDDPVELEDRYFNYFRCTIGNARAVHPEKIHLCLIWGAYAFPNPTEELLSVETARRIMEFCLVYGDGLICWGPRHQNKQFHAELPLLVKNPMHTFDGKTREITG